VEEPGFRVWLVASGDRRMEVVRAVRKVTGLSLWDSKLLMDSVPVAVMKPTWLEAAQDAAAVLEAAGADTKYCAIGATAPSPPGPAPSTRPCVSAHGPLRPARRVAHLQRGR